MHYLKQLRPLRLVLLAALAVALLSIAPDGSTGDAEAMFGEDGFYEYFYSDSTYSSQVGSRERDCGGSTVTYGQVTAYSVVFYYWCE